MTAPIPFDNSYARLPGHLFTRLDPTPVRAPRLLALNEGLADDLGIDPGWLASAAGMAVLAGNAVPEGAEPLAQLYAGHQFGGWVPQLGDGRAILLGEVVDRHGRRRDIQLKGAGPTPYSRMGDGRAALGPVLREYLVSEAMQALGIPTTRALAAVTTGEEVWRETRLPGAVLTRVAASHIRVGTFQALAARGDIAALEVLAGHVIDRHYPDAGDAMGLLRAVVAAQARLIAAWMAVGFVHGVMNTDNMAVSGETIDYGPCAFLDVYHPDTVFSSIDRTGRYAYSRQPDIAMWNLAQLASSLLPLMGEDRDAAVEEATLVVRAFAPQVQAAWLDRFRAKLGLQGAEDGDSALIGDLLTRMAANRADFTRTFRALAEGGARDEFLDPAAFDAWEGDWRARLARDGPGATPEGRAGAIAAVSPAVIPRNHRIEAVIVAAVAGDLAPFEGLRAALARPFDDVPDARPYRRAPLPDEVVAATFCGT
jgi:serine/tyrosine/threonine adenylyltransferase